MTFADLKIGERFFVAGNPFPYRKCPPVTTGSGHTVNGFSDNEPNQSTFVYFGDNEKVFDKDQIRYLATTNTER